MEGAKNVAVIPAKDLAWSDVGAWDALYDLLPAGVDGNIIKGGQHIADRFAKYPGFYKSGRSIDCYHWRG